MTELALSAAACLLFLSLSAHMLLKRDSAEDTVVSASIFVFCLMEAGGWLVANGYDVFERPYLFVCSLLPFACLLLGFTYGRNRPMGHLPASFKAFFSLAIVFPASVILLPYKAFFPGPAISGKYLPLGTAGYFFYLGLMFYCIIAIFNLEETFKAAPNNSKWKIKFEVIGFGAILSMFVFYYSQGLLYHVISMDLLPARSGVFIISLLLVIYSRVFRGKAGRVMVSGYILYRSVTVIFVGGYLLSLGLIGVAIKYLGVSFGKGMEIFIVFAAGIFTFLLLLSDRFRREVKVFVRKNFLARKHDYREVWLSFTQRLARCRTAADVESEILETFMDSFGFPRAALYLCVKDRNTCVFSSSRWLPDAPKEVRICPGLNSYFLERNRVLNTADGEYLPTSEESGFFGQFGPCIAVPLSANGELEGLIVLPGKRLASEKLIFEDFDIMKNLAKQSSVSLRIFRLSEELAEAREVAAVSRMSSFVVHDLKNLASSLALLLENSGRFISNPDFQQDMLATVRNTVSKMLELIRRLKTVPEKLDLKPEPADLSGLARETAAEVSRATGGAVISVKGGQATSMMDRAEMKKVIINMLINSLEAGAPGTVEVETGQAGDGHDVFIRITDEGCGMTEKFIQTELFRPFRTTKQKGLGIGLYQCKQIVEAQRGRIEVESKDGKGAAFTVYLPKSGVNGGLESNRSANEGGPTGF